MIFVTVGTWYKGYDRLLKAIDSLVESKKIDEEVIVQSGYSSYIPQNTEVIKFCSPKEFEDYVLKSRLVITHAGIGSIATAILAEKPAIVVPRKAELGEVSNNHQFTTAKQLEKEGKVLVAYEVSELESKLKEAETFIPVQGQGSKAILYEVQRFIDMLVMKTGEN